MPVHIVENPQRSAGRVCETWWHSGPGKLIVASSLDHSESLNVTTLWPNKGGEFDNKHRRWSSTNGLMVGAREPSMAKSTWCARQCRTMDPMDTPTRSYATPRELNCSIIGHPWIHQINQIGRRSNEYARDDRRPCGQVEMQLVGQRKIKKKEKWKRRRSRHFCRLFSTVICDRSLFTTHFKLISVFWSVSPGEHSNLQLA